MIAELPEYHHRGEIKIPFQKEDDTEIRLSLMAVSVTGKSGPEMTKPNDFRRRR